MNLVEVNAHIQRAIADRLRNATPGEAERGILCLACCGRIRVAVENALYANGIFSATTACEGDDAFRITLTIGLPSECFA